LPICRRVNDLVREQILEQTIYSVLCAASRHSSSRAALLGIKRKFLTHNGLIQQIERTVDALNQADIGSGDRVAIALDNGPDAAACCLAVAAATTAAPLNTECTAPQFHEHFSAISPKALIVEAGSESAAVRVAVEMGIPIIWLLAERHTPGGVFSLIAGHRKRAQNAGFAAPENVAFLLHTGSTSRPKMAPLTHLNVCSGAANNAEYLQLTADDRCLCVTGMFYTQGLLDSVFSPLMMAGSTVCTPGFNPLNFFAWLNQFRPSWYAAPTTIQRSILSRAPLHPEIVSHSRLRVIRCSSAPADSDLIAQVENLFRAPMLHSYGMTETSSTIAGEPLARGKRKPGSVGTAVGCEVVVVDERDIFLPEGEIGEIIVRGPSVINAYEGEARTNQRSFLNGWLRTGDLGKIDRDGYVFLTGRIKELINRGGEKTSPVEIDEAFNTHPAVAEATAFALPDKSLGKEIAVAVGATDASRPPA
jgi:acyl-CoA synthetase (AMP-forming)/AMP-acid ligase II